MAGAHGVEALFRLGVDMGADDPADEDDVVPGGHLRFERAFEIGDGIGQEHRVDGFGRLCRAIELSEF
ncbi:MAG: hypothetical protein AMJ75_10830, partial [Phycisphaerae bacterium SM1_79]